MQLELPLLLVLAISVVGLIFAWMLAQWVLRQDRGTDKMRVISDAIQQGAEAFLRRQNSAILKIAVPVALLIFILYAFLRKTNAADPVDNATQLAIWTTISFVLGAGCSVIAGYIGMWISIRSNIRTASAARSSINQALQIAMRGGAVSGFLVVTMSLIGVGGLFAIVKTLGVVKDPTKIPLLIAGYGFGASLVALFAQLGGGIYTKAADVGADLVGKVEAGIPEDDPRNPAVIADLVGDNVGDCAGRGADLFESTAAENIGAMILGATLAGEVATHAGIQFEHGAIGVMLFPLVARAFGIIASAIGLFFTKVSETEDPMNGLNRGYYVSSLFAAVGFFISTKWLLAVKAGSPGADAWWKFLLCGLIGIATAQAFVYITQYYTEYKYRPVREIAEASITGPATNIISGIAVGLECAFMPVIVICAAILGSYFLAENAIHGAGLFGTAVATMGMLGTAAYILAMDTFGPITDNAGGIVEMSEQPEEIRKKTDRLDAVGNTTKALTKGYAIGSAALAAFLLFSAYLDEVRNYIDPVSKKDMFRASGAAIIDLSKPEVFCASLIGAMLVFVFAAMAIKAVGRAAKDVITAVREEFKSKPGILKGTEKPDYGRCVDIVTQGALRQMVLPGVIAVAAPVLVGLVFKQIGVISGQKAIGAEAVAGFLMVATIAGILMANFLNNAGGAWDNAKKYIETGAHGGKRSDPHKAAVVGDTVGDPFKDTAGPALHVLIKLLATITLVMAPFFL
ncbi:MAG: sodium-translocating pyrophosphatase [Planctomycetes bacterium]|nr:sodium-translocating pyrophosphatase [Planctomycetota bacterium]